MKRGAVFDEIKFARRIAAARRVIAAGGNFTDWCASLDLKLTTGSNYLKRHAVELRDALRHGRAGKQQLPLDEALHRLRTVRDARLAGRTDGSAAVALGVSHPALSVWLSRWAPDSIDQAIADLEPDDEQERAA